MVHRTPYRCGWTLESNKQMYSRHPNLQTKCPSSMENTKMGSETTTRQPGPIIS